MASGKSDRMAEPETAKYKEVPKQYLASLSDVSCECACFLRTQQCVDMLFMMPFV
jgi:hypothetical protein